MSVEAPFFNWEQDEVHHPQFTRVLKGFDSEEVEAYVADMSHRIQALEENLQQALEERDAARRRYASAKGDAYRQVANRMADVLRTADRLAEKLRKEAEEDASRRVAEATHEAAQIRREAETDAARLRAEGEDGLREAHAETERLLGGLAARRKEIRAQFGLIRDRMETVMDQLGLAMQAAEGPGNGDGAPADEPPEPVLQAAPEPADVPPVDDSGAPAGPRPVPPLDHAETAPVAVPIDMGPDDLLAMPEGFDLVIPELWPQEDEGERGTTDRS